MFGLIRLIFVFAGLVLIGTLPLKSGASYSHKSHTYPPAGQKPAPLENSFRLSAVCFAGSNDCASADAQFKNGSDSYKAPDECTRSGFNITSCNASKSASWEGVSYTGIKDVPVAPCPFMAGYYKACCINAETSENSCRGGTHALASCPATNRKICVCSLTKYPYVISKTVLPAGSIYKNAKECAFPRVLEGNMCAAQSYYVSGGKLKSNDSVALYSNCSCPEAYSEICAAPLEGVGVACDGKYMSCKCRPEYSSTCPSYGAKIGAKACTLGSTKFYEPNSCKTAEEYCKDLSYKTEACSNTESISETCSADNSYHKCAFDKDKYCAVNGFTKSACQTNQVISARCSYDSAYHKCAYTCVGKLIASGYRQDTANAGVYYDGSTAYLTQNLSKIPTTNAAGSTYTTVAGAQYTGFSECADTKPEIIAKASQSTSVLDRNFYNLNIIFDHEKRNNQPKTFTVNSSRTWKNITITGKNFWESGKYERNNGDYYDLCVNKGADLIDIKGTLTFRGTVKITDRIITNDTNCKNDTLFKTDSSGNPSPANANAIRFRVYDNSTIYVYDNLTTESVEFYLNENGRLVFQPNSVSDIDRIVGRAESRIKFMSGSKTTADWIRYIGSGGNYQYAILVDNAELTVEYPMTLFGARLYLRNSIYTTPRFVYVCNGDTICMEGNSELNTPKYPVDVKHTRDDNKLTNASSSQKTIKSTTGTKKVYLSGANCDPINNPDDHPRWNKNQSSWWNKYCASSPNW